MKKFIVICSILMVLAIAALSAGFAVRAVDLSRFPEGGIYAYRTNSYYGVTEADNHFVVSFELFEVRNGLHKRLVDYKDIALVDENGNEYLSDAKTLTPNYADYALTKTTVRLGFSAEEECVFPLGITKVVSAKLIGQNASENKTVALGRIIVERTDSVQKDTKFFSYSAYTQGSGIMNVYNINIYNLTDNSLRINGVQFLVEGIQSTVSYFDDYGGFLSNDTYQLGAGESIILKVSFSGDAKTGGLLNVKFRPLLKVRYEGKDIFVSVPAVTEYVTDTDRNGIADYLKKGSIV